MAGKKGRQAQKKDRIRGRKRKEEADSNFQKQKRV